MPRFSFSIWLLVASLAIAPVTALAQTLQTLHGFTPNEGATQIGGLIQAADGNLHGTLSEGGEFHVGSIFKMGRGGTVTVLHTFTGADGAGPGGQLLQLSDGNFYGVTGANPGTIFRITPDGLLTTLHTFSG